MRPDLGRQHEEAVRHIAEATEPAAIAEAVVQAVREERFYVLPHPELKPMIEARLREILSA
jgi:hypothetical protein